ncbi:hypothetical protein N9322_01565 [bacterium]|jgi:hypothetical protein|nr:hypothetical protein [bacterium]|tara:strand:- start:436 stop:699 length:264 start_codon:yes stop_codon:yes gene_type:complete
MGLISEKQLRGARIKLFHIMDSVIINSEKNTTLNKNKIMDLALKVVGLSYNDLLTKQLWAEYKIWKQKLDSNIKELREHEKQLGTNI